MSGGGTEISLLSLRQSFVYLIIEVTEHRINWSDNMILYSYELNNPLTDL